MRKYKNGIEYAVFKFEHPHIFGIHEWLAENNLDAHIKVRLTRGTPFWRIKIDNRYSHMVENGRTEYMVVQLGDKPDVRFYDEEEFNKFFEEGAG